MRASKIGVVFIIHSVLFSILPVKAQELNNDYFTAHPPLRGEYLLGTVERYHLSATKGFWPQFSAGQYTYAFSELKYVLRYFPNHPKALHLLGRIAILTKTPLLPISYYRHALQLYPQYAYTHAQYGRYLSEIGDDDILIKEGIAELNNSIEMNPKLAVAYTWLANAYNKIGNSELALQADKKAEELGYQSENEGQSVKNAKERVQQDKTQVPPVKVEKLNNDYFTTPQDDKLLSIVEKYNLDTEIFWKVIMEGDSQFAISNLKDMLRYFPNHPKALYLLGSMAQYIKDESLPISYYHKALRLYPQHAYTHAQYGHYLSENSDDDILIKEGIAELNNSIEMNPKLAVAYTWLANAYNKIGNSELALQADKKAEELGYQSENEGQSVKNAKELVDQDEMLISPVKAQKINNDYFTALKNDELLTSVEHYHLGTESFWNAFMEGENHQVFEELKYVLRYFPNHPEALDLLGSIAQYTKNESLPIPYYRKALELFSQHAYTHAQYGRYLSEIGDDDILIKEGIAELNNSIEMNPKLAVAYTWLANAYNKIGNSELALQADKKAEELGYQSENEGQSVKNAKERVQQDKTQVPPVKVEKLNNDYFTIPQDDKLLSIVEKYNLGTESFWNAFMEGYNQQVFEELKYVLRYFPNHPEALYLLGRIAILIQTPSLPLSYYRKALELFPQHAYTYAQYGNYLAENSEDNVKITEGITKLKKAIEMDPKLSEAYAWLANAYYKIGNSELALQAAKQAKELGYQDKMLDSILKNNLQDKVR